MKKYGVKRIFALFLALSFVLAVCPAPAKAAATCPCCGQALDAIEWKSLSTTTSVGAGHYRLSEDTAMTKTQTADAVVTLDLNGYTLTTPENKRAFYVYSKTFSVFDSVGTGTIRGNGVCTDSGGLFRVKGTLNIYSGTFTGGRVAGSSASAGSIRVEGTVNLYGGTITGGHAEYHGGNFSVSSGTVNIYGGVVENGVTTGSGRGGNFYVTGKTAQLNFYGGTISGGVSPGNGGNIYINTGASFLMFGGTLKDGQGAKTAHNLCVSSLKDDKYSSAAIFGGTILSQYESSILRASENNPVKFYNGTITSQDPSEFLTDCACCYREGDTYRVWNVGYQENSCEGCDFRTYVEEDFVEEILTGHHEYAPAGQNTCTCLRCGDTYFDSKAIALSGGMVYEDLNAALAAGDTVLLDAVEQETVLVSGVTLDLNGHTLIAESVSATAGSILDTSGGKGELLCPDVALSDSNPCIPFRFDGLRLGALTPDAYLERLTEETVRVRFTFTEKADQTLLDDAILAGCQDLTVAFYLTWKDSTGAEQEKTYLCDPALLTKYAQKWDGRRFVATISGVDDVTDLTCTVKVLSSAASGVTVSATKLSNVALIREKLSWEAINSYPIKTTDMTVQEMRDLCVAFFEYGKTFLWTPDASVDFIRNGNGREDFMTQGTVYGGLPYVGNASGSPYRMMDYVNPETGLVDMQKAIPALGTTDILPMEALLYFGSQCAKTASVGWGRVINSADYRRTGNLLPYHGSILLGDVVMDETKTTWSESYQTKQVCQENGKQVMFEAYSQLKKADGLVYYTTAGHVIMAYSDAVVVRNEDGTINGDESYVYIIHQAQTWTDQENEAGDKYQMKTSINSKMTFASLYKDNYIPFTFAEFVSGDPVEETTVTVTAGDETLLISGTIREADRQFVTETVAENLTLSQLYDATVSTNYGISDVYIILYNARGQVLYKHAVRSSSSGIPTLKMAETGDQVTTWEYGEVKSGKTYRAEVVVQLYTGERPTVYSGTLTV